MLIRAEGHSNGWIHQPLAAAGSLNYITSLGLDLININSCACLKVRAPPSVFPLPVIFSPIVKGNPPLINNVQIEICEIFRYALSSTSADTLNALAFGNLIFSRPSVKQIYCLPRSLGRRLFRLF